MFNRMRMATKLALIAVLSLLPGAALGVLLVIEKNKSIEFSQMELYGSTYLRELRALQESVPTLRLDRLGISPLTPERAEQMATSIESSLSNLVEISKRYGSYIQAESQIQQLKVFWSKQKLDIMSNRRQISVEDRAAVFARMRDEVRGLTSFVGDKSNLILDPDLDSYYMMDATLLKLPALFDLVADIQDYTTPLFSQADISPAARATLTAKMAVLNSLVSDLESGLNTGFENNPSGSVRPALASLLTQTVTATRDFSDVLEMELLAPGDGPTKRERFLKITTDLRGIMFRLYDQAIDQLDLLIQNRIGGFEQNKILALGGVAAFAFLSIVLVFALSTGITTRTTNLARVANQLAAHPDAPLSGAARDYLIAGGDEIGALGQSFVSMSDSLRDYIGALAKARVELESANSVLEEKVRLRTAEITDKNAALESTLGELQRTQAEMTAKNAELEETLSQLKSTQRQLVIQEKMASLGSLTAGIAHEIKNPLNFVNNFAELSGELLEDIRVVLDEKDVVLPDKRRAEIEELLTDLNTNVKKINEHGKRADSIVKGMLAHSRGKAGEMAPSDINLLVTEYTNLAYHGLRAKDPTFNITFKQDFAPGPLLAAVIPQDISRVILNLVNNGCYATHQKKKTAPPDFVPTLTTRTRDLGDSIEISIKDNGKGISDTMKEKIFEPFFTTKPTGEGTGLGLSISYDIVVDEHGGTFRLESVEGDYAEFIVTIPKKAKKQTAATADKDKA